MLARAETLETGVIVTSVRYDIPFSTSRSSGHIFFRRRTPVRVMYSRMNVSLRMLYEVYVCSCIRLFSFVKISFSSDSRNLHLFV